MKRVPVSLPFYEIPDSFIPTVPLPYPKVLFQPRKPLDAPTLKKMKDALGKYNFQEHHRGKKTLIYTLDNAPPSIVLGKVAAISEKDTPPMGGYASLEGYAQAAFLIRAVDLFLSVNSYPGFRSEKDGDVDGSVGFQHYDIMGSVKRKDRMVRMSQKVKKVRLAAKDTDDDTHVWEDITDEDEDVEMPDISDSEELDQPVLVYEEVLYAKPSPLPSSINFGSPREVPNLPGMVFVYFPGNLKPDPSSMRLAALNHFFRLFGSENRTSREGWRIFKRTINSYAGTPEGMIMQHVLKGVSLSLDTQTQLFLIIDHGNYLGFVLLGAKFSVHIDNTWEKPVSAEKLQEFLSDLITHETALEEIATMLGKLPLLGQSKKKTWTVDMIETPAKMAAALGSVNFEGDDGKEVHDEIAEKLADTTFSVKYKPITPENVIWAVLMMTTLKERPIEDDVSIFFPSGNLEFFARREFQILCAFGSRGPKLFATNGAMYRIPKPDEKDIQSEIDPDSKEGKIRMPMIVIGTGPPLQCLHAWDNVVKKRSIRFEGLERSKESRCVTFRGKQRDEIWAALRFASETFPLPAVAGSDQKGKGKEIFKGPAMDAADVDWSEI